VRKPGVRSAAGDSIRLLALAQLRTSRVSKCHARLFEDEWACPQCGTQIAILCPNCQARLWPGTTECPTCHQSLCPQCGAAVATDATACETCGTQFTLACPRCGAEVAADAQACPRAALTFPAAVPSARHNSPMAQAPARLAGNRSARVRLGGGRECDDVSHLPGRVHAELPTLRDDRRRARYGLSQLRRKVRRDVEPFWLSNRRNCSPLDDSTVGRPSPRRRLA